MGQIRCAVVGVGYLGKFHARKYAALPSAQLVAVADVDPGTAERVAQECNCQAVTDYRELLGAVEAVSIAVPTLLHHRVARAFLESGAHVLVEKPMTATLAEAEDLIAVARARERVLQVGHLERFNAAVLALGQRLGAPLFIEAHRLAPFQPRATDVNVVLDLMIHDIDLILHIVAAEVVQIAASGAKVLSNGIDIANARLEFANGCVANVTSSRVSMKAERKMRIFQPDAYLAVDFQSRRLTLHRKGAGEIFPGVPEITTEQTSFEESDTLAAEVAAFLQAIQTGCPPQVSGEEGKRALATAMRITELVHATPAYRRTSASC